jgi:SWI/SNF-related matrix-associated actin-dependent regulator of chromatin subfamily A-like protein 1
MIKLRKYQRTGVKKLRRFLNQNGGAILADEMGLGKSAQFLTLVKEDELQTLIVCPAFLKINWQREAKQLGIQARILSGQKPPRHQIKFPQVTIINYDILPFWLDYFVDHEYKPKIVGVDECQYICNQNTERGKATRFACQRAKRKVMISGTPLTNRPIELYHALQIVRPDLFPSRYIYGQRYCKPYWAHGQVHYKGADNLDELHEILKTECMVRRRKEDVLKDLPAKSLMVVPIEIERRKEYEQARDHFATWVGKNFKRQQVNRAIKNEALVKGGYLKRLIAELKFEAVVSWIENFLNETGSKLLVFCIHREMIKKLHERFENISLYVHGQVPDRKRQLVFDRFNTHRKTRLLFGNQEAAGVGWNCKATSYTATLELGWSPGKHIQADDRIHGIGRGVPGQPATCYYLAAADTVEEKLCDLLQRKQANIGNILDGDDTGSDFQLFDEFIKIIRKESKRG